MSKSDRSTAGSHPQGELNRTQLAEALLSSSLDCIIVSDVDGRIVEFNRAAERTFGWSRELVIGKLMEDTIIPFQHRAAHRMGMERFLANGEARVIGKRIEIEALHAGGTVFPIELSITETRVDKARYFVATLRDITQQKQAAAELAQARASLQAFFDHVPVGIFINRIGPNGIFDQTVEFANDNIGKPYGLSAAQLLGIKPYEAFPNDEVIDVVRKLDEEIRATKKPMFHTMLNRHNNRYEHYTRFPILNAEGNITHIGGMNLDIDDQVRAQTQLDNARATLAAIFDSIPAALYLRDRDDNLVMINNWGANFLGRKPEDMIGQPMNKFREPQNVSRVREVDDNIIRTGKPETHEFVYHLAGGDRIGLMTFFPVLDGAGTVSHIGGMLLDVTELNKARRDLEQAQLLIKSIFDNAPFELYLRELDGTYVMMNKWGANYVGIEDPANMVGKNFAMFDAADELKLSWAAQSRLIETEEPVTREFHYSIAGSTKALQNTIFPVRDATGRIVRIGGVSIDVTALNLARNQRDEARDLIQSIFDNAPVELYLRELDGRYIMMNKWGANYFGVKPQDLQGGQYVWSYDSEEETQRARKAQATLLETGEPVTREFQHTIDGKRITAQNTIFPIKDSEGRIVRVGGISIDMTALNHARDQLQRAQENLHQSEKLAALGQLLAGVAHELNNPLAVVLGRSAILQEKLKDTQHAAPLQKLREAADRCTRIVKTFLAMARQTGPRREQVQVSDLIESALEMTTYSLRKNDITWTTTVNVTSETIEADKDQIVQVLINLILNAQQALAEKPEKRLLDIKVEMCPDRKTLSIAVADNGPGVPAAIAKRIFEPFFTTKSVGQGTGLGLSVCKSMIEAHGGKLDLDTTPGGGATFRVILPTQTSGQAAAANASSDASPAKLRGRILIVDDEAEIAAILADCLVAVDIECVIATNGQAALQLIAQDTFDAIFCDVSMPVMDGVTFYHKLKEVDPLLAGKLIFVSGDVLHRDWDRLSSVTSRPVMEKPFDPQQVRDAALRLLESEGGQA